MRKILLLAFLASLCGAAYASAAVCPPHWTSAQLRFRTNANNTVYDSTYYSAGVGAGPNADTTAAFPLYKVAFESPAQSGPAGVDSINVMNLHIIPRGGVNAPTVTSDSIFVVSQVSMDGRNWQSMTPTRLFVASKVVGSATFTTGAIVLEGVTDLNAYTIPWRQYHSEVVGFQASVEGTEASTIQWFGWRFVRWVVISDAVGHFEAHLGYRSVSCSDTDD